MTSTGGQAQRAGGGLPGLDALADHVRLGATVDAYLEEIGEFRPGEAWGDCANRVQPADPGLAAWVRHADARWDEIDRAGQADRR